MIWVGGLLLEKYHVAMSDCLECFADTGVGSADRLYDIR